MTTAVATKKEKSLSRSESQRKLWRVPLESITYSDNSRNPLSPELQATGHGTFVNPDGKDAPTLRDLITGTEADHKTFLNLIEKYESGEGGIRMLAQQIMANGLINPIVLRENRGGETFSIVAGERRYWATWFNALKGVGKAYIEASVNKESNADNFYRSISENSCRKNPNLMERARAVQLAINGGSTTAEIADREGCSEQTIKNRLRLLELTPKQQKKVAAGRLTQAAALELLRNGNDEGEEAKGGSNAKDGASSSAGGERKRVRKFKEVKERYDTLVGEFADKSKMEPADRREAEILEWVLRMEE